MKIILRRASLASLLVLGIAVSPAWAQDGRSAPQTAQAGGAVAVIDISKIFKEHPGFRAKLDDMKKDVGAAETALRKDRDNIKQMVEQLRQQYQPGSPDYKQQEERIATAQAQLQLKMNLQKKDFMEREAKIYYEVYKQIEAEVRYFAQRHGISLVLRYNDIDMSPEDRQKVLAGVNRAVVYQNNIDITYDILNRLRRQGGRENRNVDNRNRNTRPGGLVPGQY